MSIARQSTQQKFPFTYEKVFDGLIEIMPNIGFKIKSSDELVGRISASTGWSPFSFGENITIVVEKIDQDKTLVEIESALKLATNIVGAHRHSKNFSEIIGALGLHLQSL